MDRRQSVPDHRNPNHYDSDRRGEHHYPTDENQSTEDRRGKTGRDQLKRELENTRGQVGQTSPRSRRGAQRRRPGD